MSAIIAIDFDGTLVEHRYPEVGAEVPHAFATMLDLMQAGHRLILLTMRSGEPLDDALRFCKERGVSFWAANTNPDQHTWTHSRKVYAQIYVDDAALGCPLVKPEGERPYVDWEMVRLDFENRGLL